MSGMWLFAYVVLPLVVVGMGWAAVIWHERSMDKEDRHLPGE